MSNKVGFFQTVIWADNSIGAKVANFCESGLNISGKVYRVLPGEESKVSEFYEKTPVWVTGLKVLAYATLIIPILLGIGKVINRSRYSFRVINDVRLENNDTLQETNRISREVFFNSSNTQKDREKESRASSYITLKAAENLISFEFKNITNEVIDGIVDEGIQAMKEESKHTLSNSISLFSLKGFEYKGSLHVGGRNYANIIDIAIIPSVAVSYTSCIIQKGENEFWIFDSRPSGGDRPSIERFLSKEAFSANLEIRFRFNSTRFDIYSPK